jgi:hypothetical protein
MIQGFPYTIAPVVHLDGVNLASLQRGRSAGQRLHPAWLSIGRPTPRLLANAARAHARPMFAVSDDDIAAVRAASMLGRARRRGGIPPPVPRHHGQ